MKSYKLDHEFILESGRTIEDLSITYQTFGELNPQKSNIIWVFHAISGNSNVMDWWPGLFGLNSTFSPEKYFIICANSIGSPYGSTKPSNMDFPQFTVRDVVKAHLELANALCIQSIDTIIGGSFGGYQALEFGYSYSGEIKHMILLASSAKESAWGIAIHESQRMALKADSSFGQEKEGLEGLKAARAIAMLTYRTSENLIDKQSDKTSQIDDFSASSYINYHGSKFSETFDALCFYYLTKCIDSHNIGRARGGEAKALQNITIPTLVVGFTSDTLVPVRFQKFLAKHLPLAVLEEFESQYGHDGFLKEDRKIANSISNFYASQDSLEVSKRVVMKFGGSSLYGKEKLETVHSIIHEKQKTAAIAVVVSARGESTDRLIELFEIAKTGNDFSSALDSFLAYLTADIVNEILDEQFEKLSTILQAIQLLQDDSEFAYDRVLAFGEIISALTITKLLRDGGLNAKFIDARTLIFTDRILGDFEVNMEKSRRATYQAFSTLKANEIPVITGFIASSEDNKTVTLGRNGSNYSASLIASFIHAKEVQNWTDVDGVYSADPNTVSNAVKIKKMSYKEANEMANFGMNLLHSKTISPLMQSKIPLSIRSTNNLEDRGTIIDQYGGEKGIKAVSYISRACLVNIEGNELSQKVGIDARIFSCLESQNINVKMISQASSENGIGFVISSDDSREAEIVLSKEFADELRLAQISSIEINDEIGIVAIIGRHNFALEKAISTLRKNGIWMHLMSNSISGEHISLVVDKNQLKKAVKLVHNEVFGTIRTIHVFAFGKGKVGGEFVKQILETSKTLEKERKIAVKIIGICDSSKYFIAQNGIDNNWRERLENGQDKRLISGIVKELKDLHLNDILIVDNTSDEEVSDCYESFIAQNFDIVASNKKFNSSYFDQYQALREIMRKRGCQFYYEANVGAGLPIVGFLRSLYNSSDLVTRIRGVFSGSLSYIFNNFSSENGLFVQHLNEATRLGYAEPDPREDLNGLDVARKLVILSREVNYPAKLDDVVVENLIPEGLRGLSSYDEFQARSKELNAHYEGIRSELQSDEVLRYVAEFDLKAASLSVSLQRVKKESPLGQIRNADTHFEIFTESYGDQPIVIQGAGAGPVVTARAVYSDVLKVALSS